MTTSKRYNYRSGSRTMRASLVLGLTTCWSLYRDFQSAFPPLAQPEAERKWLSWTSHWLQRMWPSYLSLGIKSNTLFRYLFAIIWWGNKKKIFFLLYGFFWQTKRVDVGKFKVSSAIICSRREIKRFRFKMAHRPSVRAVTPSCCLCVKESKPADIFWWFQMRRHDKSTNDDGLYERKKSSIWQRKHRKHEILAPSSRRYRRPLSHLYWGLGCAPVNGWMQLVR